MCFGQEGGALKHRGQDRNVFEKLIRFLDDKKMSKESPDRLVLGIGKFFPETHYGVGTLETKGTEHLVINLRELDCVTFVENVVALAWVVTSRKKSFEAFRRMLQKIRYRQGRLQGYTSRLHYFSDWIYDNEKKGIIRDITEEIGGRPSRKAVTFMTAHADLYPPLKNEITFQKMKSIERSISRRSLFFIPKKALMRVENRIQEGDLLAITTNTEGLDVHHVGFAARVKNRVHLLHASSAEGRVVLSPRTLYRYLMESKARSGVMVARLVRQREGCRG
jgi:hypothetical protein